MSEANLKKIIVNVKKFLVSTIFNRITPKLLSQKTDKF